VTDSKKIAFKVELSRILELLADQIYQSPLALLRENTQNAFDAIRMRLHLGQDFQPEIAIEIADGQIIVSDNGIGMAPTEIEENFWYAGASGKNNDEARAAGVVGTFGIGAMANFGIADHLSVESQSARTGERTRSAVAKADLSTEEPGIEVTTLEAGPSAGTTVTARIEPGKVVSALEATTYLKQFVEFVDVPIRLNGELISGAPYESALPSVRSAWEELAPGVTLAGTVTGNLRVLGMSSGELRLILTDATVAGAAGGSGAAVLTQGGNAIRTLRTGFGLATVGVSSLNQWGGIVDLPFLKPTAGREALEANSNQQLQNFISALDEIVFEFALRHIESFQGDPLLRWITQRKRFSECGNLEVTVRPSGDQQTLESLLSAPGTVRYYAGRDQTVVSTFASDDEPLIVISRNSPKRDCEIGFLNANGIPPVDESPLVLETMDGGSMSVGHTALAMRVKRLLEEDYFLPTVIEFGKLSGDLPLLVTEAGPPVTLYLDPASTTIAPLVALYRDEYNAFGPFVKDFVRAHVFPRVANLVPSSTKEGAEAFLRRLQAKREWFEYELADQRDLDEIWQRFRAGEITLSEATDRLTDTQRSVVEVSQAQTASVATVLHEPQEKTDDEPDPFAARPAIDRRSVETPARILTSEPSLNGYGCFLALSDRVQREKGDFFLQPHTTEVVWGGQKVLFIFQHHSQRFGLYYDILCPGLVAETSGGGQFLTSTILTKERSFIPIPDAVAGAFLPEAAERKRLEIKCDVLYLDVAPAAGA